MSVLSSLPWLVKGVRNLKGRKLRNRTRFMKKEERMAYIFLAPSFIGVCIFVLLPFIDAVRRSFSEAMSRTFVGLKNYETIFTNQAFLRASHNTLRFILVCIPLLLFMSLLLSVMIFSVKRFREFMKTTFLIPMAIPAASIVLLWKIFFHEYGIVNKITAYFGGETIDIVNSEKAFYVLVFTYLWKNIGYDMVLWIAGLNGIPTEQYEAASIDGAGSLAKLLYITLPNLLPTFFIVTVLSLINSFKVFREAYLIAGDYPHESMYMLQHLFNNWFTNLDVQKMCAAAVIVAVVMLSFILILQKVTKQE